MAVTHSANNCQSNKQEHNVMKTRVKAPKSGSAQEHDPAQATQNRTKRRTKSDKIKTHAQQFP